MQYQGAKTHWHEGHPIPTGEENYTGIYAKAFNKIRSKVPIVNASPRTIVTCFPRIPIEEIFPE